MDKYINKLKEELIKSLEATESNSWTEVELIIDFPPFSNKGYKVTMKFYDNNRQPVRVRLSLNEAFNKVFYEFWLTEKNNYNQLHFSTYKDDYKNAKLKILFNREIEDNFQNNIPKSQRGKTIPWYLNEKYNQLKS